MTDAEHEAQADQPTTYPPTPGDRNEEEREKREFGRPGESEGTPDAEHGGTHRDPEGEHTSYVSREDTPDA